MSPTVKVDGQKLGLRGVVNAISWKMSINMYGCNDCGQCNLD